MADKLEVINDIPVFGHIWPKIMIDLTGSRLKHRAGTGVFGMLLRREHSGTVYTCAAGFVDLGHLRDFADLTRHYYYALVRRAQNGVIPSATRFDLLASHGGITGDVVLQRDIPAASVADLKGIINIARSISYDVSVIYEIQTYAQLRIGGRSSSFSPEDLVSNYLGTYVGGRALELQIANSKTLPTGPADKLATTFDAAVTQELDALLLSLHAVDVPTTLAAFEKIDGQWVGSSFPVPNFWNTDYVRRRNFHIRPIQPWLVREFGPCIDTDWPEEVDRQLPLDAVNAYLCTFNFEERFFNNLIFLSTQFDDYIQQIKADAVVRYGADFDKPT